MTQLLDKFIFHSTCVINDRTLENLIIHFYWEISPSKGNLVKNRINSPSGFPDECSQMNSAQSIHNHRMSSRLIVAMRKRKVNRIIYTISVFFSSNRQQLRENFFPVENKMNSKPLRTHRPEISRPSGCCPSTLEIAQLRHLLLRRSRRPFVFTDSGYRFFFANICGNFCSERRPKI